MCRYAKAETYSRASPEVSQSNDPFKLSMGDTRYLHRKLSSGPRKAQRGYLPKTWMTTEKITAVPAPAISNAASTKLAKHAPFRNFTDPQFKFGPPNATTHPSI